MSNSHARSAGLSATVFFSVACYFIFFLSLGFSSFPLQTHLRHTLPPQTASLLAGLIPIAACGTYFLARLAESKGYLRYPQRVQLAAAIAVAVMQGVLGMVLRAVANGNVLISPAVDIGICLLALGSAQSCMITLLNHSAVASLGSLAYTARAAGSAGYMVAVLFMGVTGDRVINIESQHLFVGSVISTFTCFFATLGCFAAMPQPTAIAHAAANDARDCERGDSGWKWYGLIATVFLVAICEMSYGMYSHEFLTTRLGALGYYQFAMGIALEIAILVTIPAFPRLRRTLLVVGPIGWLFLFTGCLLSISVSPMMGWASLALCLNCPFQTSANENALRMRPSVVGVATLTLAQSLGYVTAACLSSLLSSNLASVQGLLGSGTLSMPTPLWLAALPLAFIALFTSVRIVYVGKKASRNPAFDVRNLGHPGSMPGSGTVASVEKCLHDLKGDLRPNHTGTDAENVHVIVLNPLAGRIGVMAEAGSDSRKFVGGDAHSNTRPANEDSTVDLPVDKFCGDQLRKVREIA